MTVNPILNLIYFLFLEEKILMLKQYLTYVICLPIALCKTADINYEFRSFSCNVGIRC